MDLRLSTSQIKNNKIVIVCFMLIFLMGCSGDLKRTKKDPFFEKWSTLAEKSQGHSPEASPKKINLTTSPENKLQTEAVKEEAARKLPTKPINLTMRQADLKAVLRAMAKAVNRPILVKNDLKGDVSVDFRQVPWDQAFTGLLKAHGLSYVWEGNLVRVMTSEDLERELKQKVQQRDIQWVEPLMDPVIIKIDYADAKKLEQTLKGFLTTDKDGKTRGSVVLDEHSNSIIISSTARDMARMIPIIEKLDKPTPQVLIKANIVETTKGTARDLGMMWGGMYRGNLGGTNHYITPGGTNGVIDPVTNALTYTPTQQKGISAEGFASNFPIPNIAGAAGAGSLGLMIGTLGGNLLEVQLQALQQDNRLNILSSPSITTLDNQKAFTENGERVPFTTLESNSGGAPTQTTKFEDVVLRLEITPHVIDGKNLKMTISVKKDEVDMTRKSSLGDPFIIKKKTETVLIVRDGETIVISGLTKQRITDSTTGWPLLKDIPVLGYLFKADNKNEVMEEVLIFITPHILQVAGLDEKSPVPVQGQKPLPETKSN